MRDTNSFSLFQMQITQVYIMIKTHSISSVGNAKHFFLEAFFMLFSSSSSSHSLQLASFPFSIIIPGLGFFTYQKIVHLRHLFECNHNERLYATLYTCIHLKIFHFPRILRIDNCQNLPSSFLPSLDNPVI